VTGDAAYRRHVGQGPSHGRRQHALKNLVKIARVVLEIYALSMGKKSFPQIRSAAYRNMLEEDRATATGNMHKNFGKDCACGSGDILADRQTDRQTS